MGERRSKARGRGHLLFLSINFNAESGVSRFSHFVVRGWKREPVDLAGRSGRGFPGGGSSASQCHLVASVWPHGLREWFQIALMEGQTSALRRSLKCK